MISDDGCGPAHRHGGLHNVKTANVSLMLGVIVCGLITTRTPLHAQPADAPNIAGSEDMPWNKGVTDETRTAAREAFLEGNRLFKIPLFSRAVEKYSEALAKWKHPAFYFNLALAQINLGQYLEARENLERAIEYGAEPLRADRFEEAKKQLVEVRRHLGRIRVNCPTPGAEITLDGVTLFTGPTNHEAWVTARTHEVTAKKPEYVTQAKRVTVAPGALVTVGLSLRKLIEDRPWAVWKPWVVVGAGVGLAAASGVLHALSARDFGTYDSGFLKLHCADTGCTDQAIDQEDPRLASRLGRARLEQKIAVGGYIAGGAVIAAGVALLYLNRPHLAEQEDANPHTAGVAMAPVVSADMLGVMVTVSH
jgi:tetratricopeptide (TPR) repeat protein